MLKNKELETISNASVLLQYLKLYAQSDDSFYEDTGVSTTRIDEITTELQQIHNTYALKKMRASEKANEWNKAHPDAHRRHSRDCARKKKGGE